jgi:hypothetical protein
MHLDWILFIVLLGAICWGYIKYIRPQLHMHDEVSPTFCQSRWWQLLQQSLPYGHK